MSYRPEIIKQEFARVQSRLSRWRSAEVATNILAILFAVSSGLLSFAESYFSVSILSFIAGSAAFCSVAIRQFSTHCHSMSIEYEKILNGLLVDNGEKPLPDVVPNIPANDQTSPKTEKQ